MMLMPSTPQFAAQRSTRLWLAASLFTLALMLALPVWAADSTAAQAENTEARDDVRVLIDISGSMKRTDPQNLRRPALRLFTSLLPNGGDAGVWTFGQWTNMLVKHGPVDSAWKADARKAADDINSRGLYTNIEDVLRRATWDWKRPDAHSRRSLILLTDGLVDISKNAAEDAASRQRILDDILPQLQNADVTVHTIALSNESDAPLLQQLAAATGGWFETIESADGLERLFLRMFEKVSKVDTLPLKGNKVDIDNSIHEATFLIFRTPSSGPTTVTAPDGGSFGKHQLPGGVEWFEEDRYDLITVKNPPPGTWIINADIDPDNRVMVVTDLRMKSTELPNDLSVNQPLLFTMQLEQKGKIIDRPDFLQFVKVTLTQQSDNGDESQWRLRDDGKQADLIANDGIFSTRLGESLSEGEHTFILDVDGITFKRNKRQQVKVYGQPVDAQLEPLGHDRFALTIVPYVSLIDPNTLQIEVEHILPSGRFEKRSVPQVSTAEWRLEMDAHDSPGEHELTAYITGERNDGSPISVQLGPIYFEAGGDAQPHDRAPLHTPQPEHQPTPVHEDPVHEEPVHEEPVHKEPMPEEPAHEPPVHEEPAAEHPADEHATDEEHAANDEEHPPQVSWGLIIGGILGLTVLIGGLVFGGIKLWPKIKAMRDAKKAAKEAKADDKAAEEPAPTEKEKPAAPPPESEPEPEPETGVVDVDQAIDELLGDSETEYTPDPDLDLGADDTDIDVSSEDISEPAEVEEATEMDLDDIPDAAEESDETPEPETVPETVEDIIEAAEEDVKEAAKEAEKEAEKEESDKDQASEIAEIPEDLLSLDDDIDTNKDKDK